MPLIALALDLKDLIYIAGILVALLMAVAGIAGALWYHFSESRSKQKSSAASEWRQIAEGYEQRIKDLDLQVQTWKKAHDDCEGRVNSITKLNLRLQARGRNHERQINKLQVRLGMELTDWNDSDDDATSLDP